MEDMEDVEVGWGLGGTHWTMEVEVGVGEVEGLHWGKGWAALDI